MVRDLIYAGCDVDISDLDGKTPLQIATSQGHDNVVRELIHARIFFAFYMGTHYRLGENNPRLQALTSQFDIMQMIRKQI